MECTYGVGPVTKCNKLILTWTIEGDDFLQDLSTWRLKYYYNKFTLNIYGLEPYHPSSKHACMLIL